MSIINSKPARPVKIRVATANLGRNVTTTRFTANVRALVLRLVGAVICFQEIDEDDRPDEHRIVGTLLRAGWWFAGRRTRVMIAVPRTWARVGGKITHASDGIKYVSPERVIVTTIIRHRRRKTLPPIAVVNVHFPYANPKHTAEQQAKARTAQRDVAAALAGEVARLVSMGLTVVICGDTNNPNAARPHRDARLLVGRGAIDKVWVVQGSVAVDLLGTGTVNLTIDGHNAHVVRLACGA